MHRMPVLRLLQAWTLAGNFFEWSGLPLVHFSLIRIDEHSVLVRRNEELKAHTTTNNEKTSGTDI